MVFGNGPQGQGNPHDQAKFTIEQSRENHTHELKNNRYKKGSWWTFFLLLGVVGIFFGLMLIFT